MRVDSIVSIIITVIVSSVPAAYADPLYSFADLGAISSPLTGNYGGPAINNVGQITNSELITAINDSGQLTGINPASGKPAVWSGGTATDLIIPNMASGYASAINNSGTVVGWTTMPNSHSQATVWSGGSVTVLSTPGAYVSMAYDINNSGQVAGTSFFLISDSSGIASYPIATVWNGVTSTLIPTVQGARSFAISINDSGIIAGQITSNGYDSGFVWDGVSMTVLGKLGGMAISVRAINNSGDVVGSSATSGGYENVHAALWKGNSVTDLNQLINQDVVNAGWVLVDATDINNNGFIVGIANNVLTGQMNHAFLLTPVPEPETYALMLAGLGLVGFMARRRKRQVA